MSYQKTSVQKTVQLLNISVKQCGTKGFDPRRLSRELKTCNATFYDAVQLGFFTKIDKGIYLPNKDVFDAKDAKKIIDFRKAKPSRASRVFDSLVATQIPVQKEIVWDAAEYYINALKELGYTGTIEKKQVINF